MGSQLNVPQLATQVLRRAFTAEVDPRSALAKWTAADRHNTAEQRHAAARHFDAAISAQPFDVTLYKMAADLFIASDDTTTRTLDAVLRYTRLLTDIAIKLKAKASAKPAEVVPEIAEQSLSSALDYAMATVQLSTTAKEWKHAIAGYELVLQMHPGDNGTQAAIKKAQSYIEGGDVTRRTDL